MLSYQVNQAAVDTGDARVFEEISQEFTCIPVRNERHHRDNEIKELCAVRTHGLIIYSVLSPGFSVGSEFLKKAISNRIYEPKRRTTLSSLLSVVEQSVELTQSFENLRVVEAVEVFEYDDPDILGVKVVDDVFQVLVEVGGGTFGELHGRAARRYA